MCPAVAWAPPARGMGCALGAPFTLSRGETGGDGGAPGRGPVHGAAYRPSEQHDNLAGGGESPRELPGPCDLP